MWLVKDIIERIEKDKKPPGFYLNWAEYYAIVTIEEALNVLNRFPPDKRLKVQVGAGGNLFIGYS